MIPSEWAWRSETAYSSNKNGLDLERLEAEKVASLYGAPDEEAIWNRLLDGGSSKSRARSGVRQVPGISSVPAGTRGPPSAGVSTCESTSGQLHAMSSYLSDGAWFGNRGAGSDWSTAEGKENLALFSNLHHLKQRNPGGFIWEVKCVHTGKSVRGPHTGVVCLLTEYIPEYTQLKIMVQEEKLLDTVWAELSSRSHV